MTRAIVLMVTLSPFVVGVAGAWAEEPVYGPRVRLTAPSFAPTRLIGMVVALDETMLTLRRQGSEDSLQIPRSAITKIEASRHRSRKGKAAAIGALVGLGAAAVVGVAIGETCGPRRPPDWEDLFTNLCYSKTEVAAAMALLTIPAGTLVGLVAGPGEKWEVAASDRLRVAVGTGRGGGVRASLAIRF